MKKLLCLISSAPLLLTLSFPNAQASCTEQYKRMVAEQERMSGRIGGCTGGVFGCLLSSFTFPHPLVIAGSTVTGCVVGNQTGKTIASRLRDVDNSVVNLLEELSQGGGIWTRLLVERYAAHEQVDPDEAYPYILSVLRTADQNELFCKDSKFLTFKQIQNRLNHHGFETNVELGTLQAAPPVQAVSQAPAAANPRPPVESPLMRATSPITPPPSPEDDWTMAGASFDSSSGSLTNTPPNTPVESMQGSSDDEWSPFESANSQQN